MKLSKQIYDYFAAVCRQIQLISAVYLLGADEDGTIMAAVQISVSNIQQPEITVLCGEVLKEAHINLRGCKAIPGVPTNYITSGYLALAKAGFTPVGFGVAMGKLIAWETGFSDNRPFPPYGKFRRSHDHFRGTALFNQRLPVIFFANEQEPRIIMPECEYADFITVKDRSI